MINLGFSTSLPNSDLSIDYKLISTKFNTLQIMFNKSDLNSNDINDIKQISNLFKYVYIHANYQINIGSFDIPIENDSFNNSMDLFINEIIYANKINAKGIVIHTGKNVGKKYDNNIIYNNMVMFIIKLFNKLHTKNIYDIQIIIETPAGQGGEMLTDINDFIQFITSFKNQPFYNQLFICIDTCHIFQAGYDLNDINVISCLHDILLPHINKISVIHLNDSLYDCGKGVDRHADIGKGKINISSLDKFIKPFVKKNIPMVLETNSFDNVDSLFK